MKRRRRKMARRDAAAVTFTRGMVAAGLLAAIQDGNSPDAPPRGARRVLRLALQGGAALAAGSAAADALSTRDYPAALLALAAGTAGMVVIEHLLNPQSPAQPEEASHG
ncbi:hypothetical protein [Azospirillum halopraeferens]|uniref:hypothetical protein n=1 Tax=Azospirillum halopraeferens TaxID=34010 RepID=UPI000686FA55|nr:hypothetical protein [Azospirillum halopraeferens]